jgi:glucosyl-3-phosphoglycerate phosphatase
MSPSPQVLCLRHGESTWNQDRRWQGWLDPPLAVTGEEQAAVRARALAHDGFRPRTVFTSDLQRAARTAEILGAHLAAPVVSDLGFRERNGGEWQGYNSAEINERWPGLIDAWRRGEIAAPPGGETEQQVFARFDAALTRALAHVGTGLMLVVTHGGILRMVAKRAGAEVEGVVPNLAGYWFDVLDGRLADPKPVS